MSRAFTRSTTVNNFRRISAFYRWAKRARLILQDPTQNIQLSRVAEKLLVCSKTQKRGRRYYNREQVILLPQNPLWLSTLSKRFCARWHMRFSRIKSKITFPRTPLFLDPQCRHNRNLTDKYIRRLVRAATLTATGFDIPPRVLRQTCGHIMTNGNDASVLSHLGWSPQFAFNYTWLPRAHFHPDNSKS